MNLFIDTNILLSFFHFTSDDLEELKKLAALIGNNEIILFLTDQVIREFNRNRENKIADAIGRLKDQKLSLQFPQLCKDYPHYKQIRELQKNYAELQKELIANILNDTDARNLKADQTINIIFDGSVPIDSNEEIIQQAKLRIELGNPPGKGGSLGDAINWEILLSKIPEGEDIYFITDDKDYLSPINDNVFNRFLAQEWSNLKKSELFFYKSLSQFFKDNFPDILLASDIETDLLIRDLANSESFRQTRSIISQLNKYSDFNSTQVNAIIEAAISNSQIYWIRSDYDVKGFLNWIKKQYQKQIDTQKLAKLNDMFGI